MTSVALFQVYLNSVHPSISSEDADLHLYLLTKNKYIEQEKLTPLLVSVVSLNKNKLSHALL